MQIPNILTISRMVFSVLIIFTKPLSTWFAILYIYCGLSDVLDGFIARKFGLTSRYGAILDSIADLVFISVIFIKIIPIIILPIGILIWIISISFIRLISLIAGYFRYHSIVFLHTYANKTTGILLFFFPLILNQLSFVIPAFIICGVASLSAIEELIINAMSNKLNRNVKSIYDLKNE